jgi:ribonuclease H2 subunit B
MMERRVCWSVSPSLVSLIVLLTTFSEGRIKTTCELVSQYLSLSMKSELLASYECASFNSLPDITLILSSLSALDKHLKSRLAEETLLKTTTNTGKGKGGAKGEADKKRKAPAKRSHGVDQLKKANTTGMAKLSSFFTKKEESR